MPEPVSVSSLIDRYFYSHQFPTMWCPGCGNGVAAMSTVRAIDKLGIDPNNVIHVAGIGCASVAHWYTAFSGLQAAHGRALPSATGIKMANPELTVIVTMGDGDCAAIGGNHLIHACRRNIDITAIVYNNFNYGMTGGQIGPTTPSGALASTAPYGNSERPFDLCRLVEAAGATYVARGSVYYVKELVGLIEKGMSHKGFSFIDVLTPCPTVFGRKNNKGSAGEMWRDHKELTFSVKTLGSSEFYDNKGKMARGILIQKDEPEFIEEYDKVIAKAQRKGS